MILINRRKLDTFTTFKMVANHPEFCVLSKFNEKEGSIVVQREPVFQFTIYSDGGETILNILSCAFPVCFWAFQPYIIVFVWNFNAVLDENGWLQDYLRVLVTYHRFFSFCLYIIGFVWFVLSLVNKYYMKQFSLFAWTHVALLIVVTQSYLIIQNIFEGLIWYFIYNIFRELSFK